MSEFIATPTMEDFMLATEYVRVLAGPIGGGKSVCCAHDLMRWATEQKPNADGVRKTRFLVVRNTYDQLMNTTLKTIEDWFPPGVYGKKVGKTLFYRMRLPDGTLVSTDWLLIALDTPDDVRKALSLEATGLWGNECRELHPDVVDGLLMRVNRYPSAKDGGITRAGAIFDTNMPDEDTWWEDKMSNPPRNWSIHIQPEAVLPLEHYIDVYDKDPDDSLTMQDKDGGWWTVNPKADNINHLEPSYYPETLEGKTKDFIRVYLRCEYGRSMGGVPVYEQSFDEDRHVSAKQLNAIDSEEYPLVIGLDFGRTPCAIVCQTTPHGGINVLSEVTSENMGIRKFIRTKLKPHLLEHYPGLPRVVAPDPAGAQKTQVGEESPYDILVQEGFKIAKPGTNDPLLRIGAVETVLSESTEVAARVRINKCCKEFIHGFRGKYRWKTNRQGDVVNSTTPEKNHPWSDIHDGFQYAILVIQGGPALGRRTGKTARKPIQRKPASGWT